VAKAHADDRLASPQRDCFDALGGMASGPILLHAAQPLLTGGTGYMDFRLHRFSIVVFLFASLCVARAATVRGVVTDPLGAVVTNARVELLAHSQSVAEAVTDSSGRYAIKIDQAGRYQLRVMAPSFATTESDSFYVSAAGVVSRDVLLKIRNMAEQVVVTATGLPVSEAQEGASVDVLTQPEFLEKLDVASPLVSIPGLQVAQTGQRGGVTSLFIRGGNSNSNKVLIDGVPVNDIGGVVDFGSLSLTAIDYLEVFRGPNSVLYGSDALAGVVSMATQHGTTPLPELSYALDGGNFGTYRQQGTLAGAWRRFDYLASFARFDSSDSVPNSRFHNATFAANAGWTPNATNSFRLTVRRIASGLGSPNAIELFGIADNGQSAAHDTFVSATYENQLTPKWHNLLRYGTSRLDSHFEKPSPVGINADGFDFIGLPVTIKGANGFTVSGQAFLTTIDCCPSHSAATANRDFVYAQTDYRFNPHLIALFGYRYEAERGISEFDSPSFGSNNAIDRRNMSFILESHGDIRNRIFYSVGGGIEKNAVFGTEATPRVSLAYHLFRPASGWFHGTKLKFNFGKGVKEPDIFGETSSLFDLLSQVPGGAQQIQKFGIRPIGAERSRSYDFGFQQSITDRALLDVTLFHNQFYDQIEFVSSGELPLLGVPQAVADLTGFGASINSSNYRAQGVETELQVKISSSLTARGGYTYLDTRVQRSFSSDALAPSFNPLIPGVPIGAFGPLVGARPFRRAPHTGFLALSYSHRKWSGLFQGTFVGRRDDSTFLGFSDASFGNTLLLPNRNLDAAYQKLDISGDYRLNRHLALFTSVENLLSQRYSAVFGFPSLPFTVRSGVRITVGGER
jgi:vitamin B12 transporter